jgi:uncharacterized protein YfkK (UPF0435 family)
MSRLVLDELRNAFVGRGADLSAALQEERVGDDSARIVIISEYCVVQLQDCWTRFTRDLIVFASLGNASFGPLSSRAGQILGPGVLGVQTFADAVTILRSRWTSGGGSKPPWWEPRWFDQRDAIQALKILQPVNGNDINAALGSSANPIEDLRAVRNFVAHRGATSAPRMRAVAQSVGSLGWAQPADVVNTSQAGVVVFDSWVARLSAVATAAVR